MEYYLHTMKEEIKAVAQFSNNIRKKEQQALANGRKLLDIVKGLKDDDVILETINDSLHIKQKNYH